MPRWLDSGHVEAGMGESPVCIDMFLALRSGDPARLQHIQSCTTRKLTCGEAFEMQEVLKVDLEFGRL